MKRIAIVGGGITGLATAFYIEQFARQNDPDSFQIEVFESSNRLGGKIITEKFEQLTLEMGAESFLARKPWGLQLCKELRIEDSLRSTQPENKKTFIWHDGEMHRLPEGLSGFIPASLGALKSTTLLNLFGKIRIAADLIIPASRNSDDESVAGFISRRIGKQAYERIVEPLLCGIYCANGDEMSLAATFPQLRELERKHGSLIKGLNAQKNSSKTNSDTSQQLVSPFATFANGMSTLISAVAEKLQQTQIHINRPVAQVSNTGERWAMSLTDGTVSEFDEVVLAIPAHHTSKLIREADPDLAEILLQIPHASTALLNLWYDAETIDHPLDGYGFVIPTKDQQSLTAVTWTSSKHYQRCPDNLRLIRAYLGKSGSEITSEHSDDQLWQITNRELQRTMGLTASPVDFRIQRWPQGSPQYTMRHPELLSTIDNRLRLGRACTSTALRTAV